MEEITLFDKTFKTFIPHEKIEQAIDKVAEKLNQDFKDCEDIPVILCILNGSIMFTSELMKRLTFKCAFASMKLSSYSGTESTGEVKQLLGPTSDLKGKRVIVVEDIVDTGNTIVALDKLIREMGAKDVKICTMLLKPDMYDKDIKLDYVAMEIPNAFIVGFGLDYNELGRNYKDIYVIKEQ